MTKFTTHKRYSQNASATLAQQQQSIIYKQSRHLEQQRRMLQQQQQLIADLKKERASLQDISGDRDISPSVGNFIFEGNNAIDFQIPSVNSELNNSTGEIIRLVNLKKQVYMWIVPLTVGIFGVGGFVVTLVRSLLLDVLPNSISTDWMNFILSIPAIIVSLILIMGTFYLHYQRYQKQKKIILKLIREENKEFFQQLRANIEISLLGQVQ